MGKCFSTGYQINPYIYRVIRHQPMNAILSVKFVSRSGNRKLSGAQMGNKATNKTTFGNPNLETHITFSFGYIFEKRSDL